MPSNEENSNAKSSDASMVKNFSMKSPQPVQPFYSSKKIPLAELDDSFCGNKKKEDQGTSLASKGGTGVILNFFVPEQVRNDTHNQRKEQSQIRFRKTLSKFSKPRPRTALSLDLVSRPRQPSSCLNVNQIWNNLNQKNQLGRGESRLI